MTLMSAFSSVAQVLASASTKAGLLVCGLPFLVPTMPEPRSLALGPDVPTVRALALEVAQGVHDDEAYRDLVLDDPEVWGLEAIGAEGLVLRITMKTVATMDGPVERALRERLIASFEANDISIGVPQRLVWNVDAQGTA